ncbi:MAG: hypothetical protein IK102_06330 [Treponema sp.]|nr:hypothetical protein [Treponema sp.]
MLNKNLLLISLLVVGVVLTGCGKKKSAPAPTVSFNISGADALGGRDINPARYASGARAAADNSNGSALVKIMQDGTLESALSANVSEIDGLPADYAQRMTHYAKLTDIFLPPKNSGCSDVFLLFDGETHFPSEYQDKPGNVGYWSLSQLLCIHSDNTWTDIMYDDPMGLEVYPMDTKKNIQIADDGSLFLLFRDGGGWEYYIRKYNPATKTVSELCRFGRSAPLDEEIVGWTDDDWQSNHINIDRLEISKDGKWAYIQIRKDKKNYIHVVSVDDPTNCTDIVLDENNTEYGLAYPCWDFDKEANQLYYVKIERYANNESGHAAGTIDKRIVYKADYNGKNPEKFKELSDSYFDALMVVAKDKVWMLYYDLDTTEYPKYTQTIRFLDVTGQNEKLVASVPLTESDRAYCCGFNGDGYTIKDGYVYMCYGNVIIIMKMIARGMIRMNFSEFQFLTVLS